MNKLVNIIKTTGVIVGTGLATYGGIKLGENLENYLPHTYMFPEIAQGVTAFIVGSIGNKISKEFLNKEKISESEVYSITH